VLAHQCCPRYLSRVFPWHIRCMTSNVRIEDSCLSSIAALTCRSIQLCLMEVVEGGSRMAISKGTAQQWDTHASTTRLHAALPNNATVKTSSVCSMHVSCVSVGVRQVPDRRQVFFRDACSRSDRQRPPRWSLCCHISKTVIHSLQCFRCIEHGKLPQR